MRVKFFDREGASGLFLRLLILLTAGVCLAGDFGAGGRGGILLYRDDGQITYWSGGGAYRRGGVFDDKISVVRINSTMPWLPTDITIIGYSAKSDLGGARPEIFGGALASSEIKIVPQNAKILNDKVEGFYIGSRVGVDVGKFEFVPSALFARMKFGHGDFYWFYGRPDLPGFARFEVSAEYDKTHKAGFTYDRFDLGIFNDYGDTLFHSDNYGVGASYGYSYRGSGKSWEFRAASGFNYVEMLIGGALTAANQRYFLFPYSYYDVSGSTSAFAAWAALSLDVHGKHVEHRVKAGAGNIFTGEVSVDSRFRYRKFYTGIYGGEELSQDVLTLELAGTRGAFVTYSVESRGFTVADRACVYWGLQKILGGYKFNDAAEKKGYVTVETDWGALARTALLSGLLGSLRVTF